MFAVEVYPPLKDKIIQPIAQLRDNIVNTSGQGRLILTKKSKKKYISTCNQYKKAQQQFYVPQNSYDPSINSFFVFWCGSLDWLEKAKPAKISYLQNYNLKLSFAKLPSSLFIKHASDNSLKTSTLIEKYPDATLIDIKPQTITVESKKTQVRMIISLLAKADFNNNGNQDLMLSVAQYSFNGNYQKYGIYVLSKNDAESVLKVVEFVKYS